MIRVERTPVNASHPDDTCDECRTNGHDNLFKATLGPVTVWFCHSCLKSLQWAITEAFR